MNTAKSASRGVSGNLPRVMKFTPPYYAVIFTSRHVNRADPEYDAAGDEMFAHASKMPGFLGIESAQNPDGFGITVSYWKDEASIKGWREHPRHREIQRIARDKWYESYTTHVAKVERLGGVKEHG